MPYFSIIIVSWNALGHLKTYLPSVTKTDYPDYEIILADNNSVDGSAEWVKKRYPHVKIVPFDENYGYCRGNNQAVHHATGDILLFLNNDVRVVPNWLNALADVFEENQQVAALQPKLRSVDHPEYFEYAGAAGGFLDQFGYPFCRGRIFDTVEIDHGQYDNPRDIFWASGAALAVRKNIFEEQGGFDEDFEFHMEEIDLCWRIWNAGYKVRFCPPSLVYHLGGGSMAMDSPRKVYYNYRNNLKMLWKNCSADTLNWRFSGRYLLDIIAGFRSLFNGEWKVFKAIVRAHYHFWKSFPLVHEKRAYLQHSRKVEADPDTLLPLPIIWKYFIKGKHTFRDLF